MEPQPLSLPNLTPKEAITDALYRIVLGFDQNNWELLTSGLIQEDDNLKFVFGLNENSMIGQSGIKPIFDNVGPMDTQHLVTNIRIALEPGATTAKLWAQAHNQHIRAGEGQVPGAPRFTAGGHYFLEFMQQNGEWKAKTFRMQIIWTEGDRAVMGRE